MKKFKLGFGYTKTPSERYEYYDSHIERCAQMWAARLNDHPEFAWYNDPADPGLVTNENLKWRDLRGMAQADFVKRIKEIINERNELIRNKPETESIENAISNLINLVKIYYDHLPQILSGYDGNYAEDLKCSVDDVEAWIDGISEESGIYSSRGWIDSMGRP